MNIESLLEDNGISKEKYEELLEIQKYNDYCDKEYFTEKYQEGDFNNENIYPILKMK